LKLSKRFIPLNSSVTEDNFPIKPAAFPISELHVV
jgi:hypothetical protein